MNDWVVVSHGVSIAGQVTDAESGKVIAAGRVHITAGPQAFTEQVALKELQYGGRWLDMEQRLDRTGTAKDGHFHFMDLPDGTYTLEASLPGSGSRYGKVQTDITLPPTGDDRFVAADLLLPPTAFKGRIDDTDGDPVFMARIRVSGSNETVYSDAQGNYRLTAIEAGSRTIAISAGGFAGVSQAISLSTGQTAVLNVVLTPI